MSSSAELVAASAFDGCTAAELSQRLDLPRVELFEAVGSTLDVAHALAGTAPTGTLVLSDRQTAGRGRHGRRWASSPGSGIWLTLIERPTDLRALDVLSLRCGLFAAHSLDALAGDSVQLKWPNDLYLRGCKLAGILIETRWKGTAPEWVAIGFGLNVRAPELDTAIGLPDGTSRLDALALVVPALRVAARASGLLTPGELADWQARDVALGRAVVAPAEGVVGGIGAGGELLIREPSGIVSRHRSGSLTFEAPLPCS